MADDPRQTLAEAKAALKKAAAAQMVRKERHEAKVAQLKARRAELADGEARAEAAAEPELLADVRRALVSLDEALALEEDLLATAEHDLQESLRELNEIPDLARKMERATLKREVLSTTTSDPFAVSAEDRALENARNAIAELEARVEIESELAAESQQERDLQRRLRALDREDKDAAARAELEALKAAKQNKPSSQASDGDASAPKKKPKRTL